MSRQGTKCQNCEQTHPQGPRRNPTKHCIFHDADSYVEPRLKNHDGLPYDCPGCLAHASIDRKQYGKGTGAYKTSWKLTCRECGVVYFWCEGKDDIPKGPK